MHSMELCKANRTKFKLFLSFPLCQEESHLLLVRLLAMYRMFFIYLHMTFDP